MKYTYFQIYFLVIYQRHKFTTHPNPKKKGGGESQRRRRRMMAMMRKRRRKEDDCHRELFVAISLNKNITQGRLKQSTAICHFNRVQEYNTTGNVHIM